MPLLNLVLHSRANCLACASFKLSALCALFACANAAAQSDAAIALERQSDEAFRQVLQQPQNLALWSVYAELLIKQGNYEGGRQ